MRIFLKYALLAKLIVFIEAKTILFISNGTVQRIGSRYYTRELLTNVFDTPKELAYDSATRTLFFMYMDDYIGNSGRAFINVATKQAMKIEGIQRNKATAVDPDTGEVYFGSDDGLYKYDPLTNKARQVGLYNMNILKLVIRNNQMFAIDANNHMIYKIFNNGQRAVKLGNAKTVMEVEIDNESNVHYVTMCGVYCALKGQEEIKNKDLSIVYKFIVDNVKTFGLVEDGIYDIDCQNGTARKVLNLGFIPNSLIFGDYGEIYYSIDSDIIKLTPMSSYTYYIVHKNKNKKLGKN